MIDGWTFENMRKRLMTKTDIPRCAAVSAVAVVGMNSSTGSKTNMARAPTAWVTLAPLPSTKRFYWVWRLGEAHKSSSIRHWVSSFKVVQKLMGSFFPVALERLTGWEYDLVEPLGKLTIHTGYKKLHCSNSFDFQLLYAGISKVLKHQKS